MANKRARLDDNNDPLSTTDQVLAGFEQFSKSASHQTENTKQQPVNHKASQQVEKSKLRKATFQLQESVIDSLDKCHLKLQLERGKAETPYKEVIVEEAIARLLEELKNNQGTTFAAIQKRQHMRG